MPSPPPLSPSASASTACAAPAAEASRLTRLIQRTAPCAWGQISALEPNAATSYSNTSIQAALARRGRAPLPALVLAHQDRITAVGECFSGILDAATWRLVAARTLTSLLAANQASGTYLGWMSHGPSVARAMLLDSHTVALEADIAFRDASPRILPAEQLLSKTAPYLPATERELVTLLVAARALLSSPSIPSLLPAVSDRLLSPPCCPPVPVPVPPAPRRTTRTPPRYSPPRMAIADLTTSPHSTSHPKRSSSGGGSPGKRLAIDVHAWRSGESGAALFDLSIDRADDRCCSPTEIDTPTPSETARSAGRSKAEALANHKLEADETSGSCRASPLQAEETLRPGRLAFREEETVMPGALTLQPAWKEERFGPTATMQPSTSASTMHFKRLSLHQPATVSCGALKLRSRALAIASAAVDSTGMATGNERLDDATELKLEDYLGVLVERKLRVVLVSSAEMDGAVEAIRAGHS